ncbi:MAG: TrkA family potassium uptake protein [Chloroflexi bacterium]|nr:TrkA family potassium uptake protein [Chloroflexota bacterium]
MKVIILGCGRLGAYLAQVLDQQQHQVTIIDRNSDSFNRLPPEFRGTILLGVGIDEDVLRRAGIEHADAFIAATNGDNTNAMAAEIARLVFQVPKVIARLYDPVRADTFREFGVIETVCPTVMSADKITELLMDGKK